MTVIPMTDTWTVDSSPLIVLAKIGRLDLLTAPGRRCLVAGTVAHEIGRGSETDPARLALAGGWGERVGTPSAPKVLAAWRLDAGEEATLAAAPSEPRAVSVLDDGNGRRAAKALRVPHIGTVGVVLRAREAGHIPAAAPPLQALRATGLYLPADGVMQTLLGAVGETWP